MNKLLIFVIALAMMAFGGTARAADPLVDVAWLKASLGKPGVVVLDLRGARTDYMRAHVPGALYTDYAKDGWRVKDKNGTPAMLPEAPALEKLIGGLGIDNATHVVLVPKGSNSLDVGVATRVYWTFKVMGHDNVSILNGGWDAWSVEDEKTKTPINPMETGNIDPKAKSFKANVRAEMIPTKADIKKALADKKLMVDNRPSDYYLGVTHHPQTKRPGTIPGAKNVPEAWLTTDNRGMFRDKASMAKLYAVAGVPTHGEQINFCNTGHWASLGWFASSEILGNKQVRMYDGSMVEWTADPDAPMEKKVDLGK